MSAQHRVKYRPQGAVLSAFGRSNAFMQVIMGPLGSGKTKASVFKILKYLSEQKPDGNGSRKSRWMAIRNTYPDLQTTTIREFKEVVSPLMGSFVNGHPPTYTFEYDLLDGSSVSATIDFLALDRPDDVKKLRGFQGTGAYFNEVKELPKSVIDMALGRVDRYPAPGASSWVGGIGDTNAWDEDHWLAELEEKWSLGQLEGWEFFRQPGAVVRAEENEPGAVQSLNGTWWKVNSGAENLIVLRHDYYHRQIAGKKDDWIRVNLANEIGLSLDGKPVHPEYQESTHRAKEILKPMPGIPIYVGLDFGLSPAAAFAQRQPSGRWYVFDEIICEDMGAKRLADEIKKTVAEWRPIVGRDTPFIFRGDPSGDNRSQTDEQTVFQILRANGVNALPASTNDPAVRREALTRPLTRMVLGGPGILFSPKCRYLRKGLAGGFHYKRVRVSGAERFKNEPEKNIFSHVVEACEYGLMDAGEHVVVNASQMSRQMPARPVQPRSDWNVFGV